MSRSMDKGSIPGQILPSARVNKKSTPFPPRDKVGIWKKDLLRPLRPRLILPPPPPPSWTCFIESKHYLIPPPLRAFLDCTWSFHNVRRKRQWWWVNCLWKLPVFWNKPEQSIIFIPYILIESTVFQLFRATLSLSPEWILHKWG